MRVHVPQRLTLMPDAGRMLPGAGGDTVLKVYRPATTSAGGNIPVEGIHIGTQGEPWWYRDVNTTTTGVSYADW